jgi:hypothetical protein
MYNNNIQNTINPIIISRTSGNLFSRLNTLYLVNNNCATTPSTLFTGLVKLFGSTPPVTRPTIYASNNSLPSYSLASGYYNLSTSPNLITTTQQALVPSPLLSITGGWTLTRTADTLYSGAFIPVTQGSHNAGTTWTLTSPGIWTCSAGGPSAGVTGAIRYNNEAGAVVASSTLCFEPTPNPTLSITATDTAAAVLSLSSDPVNTVKLTSGTTGTAPATVAGYIQVFVDGFLRNIPYY